MYNDVIKSEPKESELKLGNVARRFNLEIISLEAQIDKLAGYLLKNDFHADPLLNYKAEGSAVDMAIRLLKLYTNRTE